MTAYVDGPWHLGRHPPQSCVDGDPINTWNGPIRTQLYGNGLRNLCKNTENNLSRLSLQMQKLDPCLEYGMQHWHPTSRPTSASAAGIHEDIRVGKWGVMFADNSKLLDEASPIVEQDSQWDSYTDPPAALNFCYLCSTLEEHRRHMLLHKPKKRPTSARPRIEYIAPRPRQKRRQDKEESRVMERLYKVDVYTTDTPGAGTNAKVYITLKGSLDLLQRTQLVKKHGSSRLCFVAGSREVFYTKGPLLGNLQILTIEHDGTLRKQGWHLDRVEITDVKAAKTWVFKCADWLSTFEKPHYSNKRDLLAEDKQAMPLTDYTISVHTGKQKMAGTDADVFITITGQHGHSKKIHLVDASSDKKCFEKDGIDTFRMSMYSLGELKKIRIEHDGKGFAAGWNLDKVIIEDSSRPRDRYYFTYGGWIAKDEGDGRLWRDIPAKKSLPKELKDGRRSKGDKTKYTIIVKTADVKYAGTDANVFIQMVGPNGTTPKITLDDAKNNFERNMVDNFDIEAVNVGPLDHIVVGHDNSGPGSGWFLEKINIRRYLPRREVVERLRKMKKRLKKGKQSRDDKGNVSSDDEEDRGRRGDLRHRERQRRKDEKKMKKSQKAGNFFSVSSSSSSSSSDSSDDDARDRRRPSSHGRRTSSGSRRESMASRREFSASKGRQESIYSRRESRRVSSAGGRRRASTSASRLGVRDELYDDDDGAMTELKVPHYEDYTVVCNRWLAKNEDDGLFVRELPITTKSTYFKDQAY